MSLFFKTTNDTTHSAGDNAHFNNNLKRTAHNQDECNNLNCLLYTARWSLKNYQRRLV